MTSYIKLLKKIENFYNQHLQVFRFGADFLEQIDNFTGKNEKYPLVYVVPPPSDGEGYLTTFTIDVYCLDVIQKDRANINNIISDTNLILSDLYRFIEDGEDREISVIGSFATDPMNNAFCDYLAGNKMTITIEVETQSICEIPIDENINFNPILTDADTMLSAGENTVITWQ